MIKIFNPITQKSILIPDSGTDGVIFTPRDYEVIPFVKIELIGFDFMRHALKCDDCSSFVKCFGSETLDWYIDYGKGNLRLDVSNIGKSGFNENQIKHSNGKYEYGTTIRLKLHQLQNEEEIKARLELDVQNEEFEKACILRDHLNNNRA